MTKLRVRVPPHSIFVLEDSEKRIEWFLERMPNAIVCRTAQEGLDALRQNPPFAFYFLDRDLGLLSLVNRERSGEEVAAHMAAYGLDGRNVLIHSWNEAGRTRMKAMLPYARVQAFGSFEIEVV